ncbi:MAG: L,D-transpeptidase family protein [Sphingomicrobium sp.]
MLGPPVNAAAGPPQISASARSETIGSFYEARGNRPLWFGNPDGRPLAPWALIDLLGSARADGLDPDAYGPRDLDRALRKARSGNFGAVERADRLLSEAFVAYVRDMRRTLRIDMVWVDPALRPSLTSPRQLLEQVAAAASPEAYLAEMQWMNPLYAGLRRAITDGTAEDRDQHDLLALNLERARALPSGRGRYIVVNTSAAQLTMYEGGKAVDTMRVVVGKPVYPTPMMAALIRFTSLNPYWNVPPDLAAERIAPNVIKDGKAYLKLKGYQVLSSWDDGAKVVDPDIVDWKAVAAGKEAVRIRQLPGPANAMGKMKFMFPNAQGVYLHDTPEKNLLGEETRMFSGGCVRLEDASRLARWLYAGVPPSTKSTRPEQRVDLPNPVPVFLTYLTAVPADGAIAYLPDVYGRDKHAFAATASPNGVASR